MFNLKDLIRSYTLEKKLNYNEFLDDEHTWCTAKLELIPAPFISLPWTYSLRTDGPMPLGHTAITLKF